MNEVESLSIHEFERVMITYKSYIEYCIENSTEEAKLIPVSIEEYYTIIYLGDN